MRQNLIQAGGITILAQRCWQRGVWRPLSTDCSDVGDNFDRLRYIVERDGDPLIIEFFENHWG